MSGKFILQTIFFLLVLTCAACTENSADKNEITVSAAASLRDAFREVATEFEKSYQTKVNFNFASSGALQKQIEAGAPVDVFASAGKPQMDALETAGKISPETRRNFARNQLVLIVRKPAQMVDFLDAEKPYFISYLEQKNLKIALGNPKTVPAGQYAEQVLAKYNLWEKIQPQLIFAEDVRQVLDYVARGETDAGIVYSSDWQSEKEKVQAITGAPADSHEPILYPIAIVKDSKKTNAAQKFVDFVTSYNGQAILQKYGFQTAQ